MTGLTRGLIHATLCLAASAAVACGSISRRSIVESMGETPTIPRPVSSLIPTVNVVTAVGWSADQRPHPGEGLRVEAFARNLQHPRWLYVLPNGDVLVAETNAPPRPQDSTGLKGWFFTRYQKQAGGAVPSANRIVLLRDADGDGSAELRTTFLDGLNAPFGMALIGNVLYVANTDAVVRMPYDAGSTSITGAVTFVVALPAGARNHHWTKNLIASADGTKLFIAIGSNSNAAEHGLSEERGRAQLWELDVASGRHRVYATGLRNPVGMALAPESGALWVAVNERDELGHDLVPDYMTAVRDGGFYGWPYSYFGQHVDRRVSPRRADLVATALVPDYALGAHTASLGLAASAAASVWPRPFGTGLFVGQHGSWNRTPRSGYKVLFVPFTAGRPSGPPVDVLTGFVTADGKAMGRPVGVAVDTRGALLVADDVGNVVWRVSYRGDEPREPTHPIECAAGIN